MEKNIINKLKTITIISVMVALVGYYILNKAMPNESTLKNALMIINIIGVGIQMFVYNSRWIKYFDRKNYIEGDYRGTSEYVSKDKSGNIHSEYVSIKQTLISTTITGKTTFNSKENSYWRGNLIKKEEDHFIFYIELDNDEDTDIKAILSLEKYGNEFSGYYYSTKHQNNKAKVNLRKDKK